MVIDNRNKKILIVLLVLIGVYFLIYFISLHQKPSGTPFSKIIKTEDIVEIEIINRKDNEKIKIGKNGNRWDIMEPVKIKAKTDTVNNLVSKIVTSDLNGPFTEKEKFYPKFEIYPNTSPIINLKSNFKTVSFLTGKTNSDFNGTFIKFSDSKSIYELSGVLPYEILISSYEVMDKKLFSIEKTNAIKLIINYKNKEVEFVKNNEIWSSKSNIEPETFVSQIFNLEFEKIANYRELKRELTFKVFDNLKVEEEVICWEVKEGYACSKGEISFFVAKSSLTSLIDKLKSVQLSKLK